jgi:hypothetical protein
LALRLKTGRSVRGSFNEAPPRTNAAADPKIAQITVSATAAINHLMPGSYSAGGAEGSTEAVGSAEAVGSTESVSFRTGKSGAATLNPQAATIMLEARQSAVVVQTKAARMLREFRCMQTPPYFYGGSFACRLQRKVFGARQNHRTQ